MKRIRASAAPAGPSAGPSAGFRRKPAVRRTVPLALLAAALSAGAVPAVQDAETDHIRLVAAERMEHGLENGRAVRKLIGGVRLVQGPCFMECDEASWIENEEYLRLVRNVRIYDGKRILEADEVEVLGSIRTERASGRASIRSGSRRLTADRIVYRQDEEQAEAVGRVTVTDTTEHVRLESDSAFYDRKRDTFLVRGRPRAVRIDTTGSGKDWRLRGLRMEMWGADRRITVTDSVRIEQDGLEAVARAAEYRSKKDLLILMHSPRVTQPGRIITGDSMAIEMRGARFSGGRVFGKAGIVSEDSAGRDILKGGRIFITARGDTLDRVVVEERAESAFRVSDENGRPQGVNEASGDRIELIFDGKKLLSVEVESRPASSMGVFSPADAPETPAEKPGAPGPEQDRTDG
jgi:lipopolysaccharide export system protein LptA